MDEGTKNDAQETPLTAGIALSELPLPFIIENCQLVVVMLCDYLEVDGLPMTGVL